MRTFILHLPRPPKVLSPNAGKAAWRNRMSGKMYSKTIEATTNFRQLWKLEARNNPGYWEWTTPQRAGISIVYGTKGAKSAPDEYCPRDVLNAVASLKAGIDGLIDAKVLPGDSYVVLEIRGVSIDPKRRDVRVQIDALGVAS